MDVWVSETDFSEIFLKAHHDGVLRHTYHQAQTWRLDPCGCEDLCVCAERRAQMLLSLNAAFLHPGGNRAVLGEVVCVP